MKILAIISNPPSWTVGVDIGGGEITMLEMLKRWHSWGVSIQTLESYPPPSVLVGAKYPVNSIRLFKGKGINVFVNSVIFLILCVWKAITKCQKFDAIIAAGSSLTDVFPAYVIGKLLKKPVIVLFQVSSYGSSFSKTYRLMRQEGSIIETLPKAVAGFIMLKLAKHVAALCCISNPVADMLRKIGYSSKRIYVTGIGVSHEIIDRYHVTNKKYCCVFLGRVEKNKGVEDLLKAWRIIVDQMPHAKLLIIGSGDYLEEAKHFVSETTLTHNVKFSGFIVGVERFLYLKDSRISVYPTKIHEGWAHTISESLACGLPVVAYYNPVIQSIFGECESFFLVPKGNVKKLASMILNLLGNESSLEKLAKISKNYSRRFSWNPVAKHMLAIVENVTDVEG